MFENVGDTLDSRKNSLSASVGGCCPHRAGELGKLGLGDNPIIATVIKSDSILLADLDERIRIHVLF